MMSANFSLKDRKVLITGASSGIGRAVCVYCSELGAKVVLVDRDGARLEESRLMLSGKGHCGIVADLAGQEDLSSLFEQAVADGQKLSGMVHCAGTAAVAPLKMLTRTRLQQAMDIHFYAFVELVRQYSKKRYSDGGSIVAISSILTDRTRPYELAYIAAKAALRAAVPALSQELYAKGIRLNALIPGNVKTEMVMRTMEEYGNGEAMEQEAKKALYGWESPEDAAAICAFLLSDLSRTVIGRTVYADGGII